MDEIEYQKQAVLDYRSASTKAPPIPISKIQAHFATERPIKGNLLVAKTTVAPPGDAQERLRSLVWQLFISKGEGSEKLDPPVPAQELHTEWLGIRPSIASAKSPQAALGNQTEAETYLHIKAGTKNDVTIFYLVGGAWFRGGLAHVRPLLKNLCEQSGGRVFTMQPRLAPQYTMPSILLDALLGYFSLLSPSPGALHQPIHPGQIVLAGDSAGATLQLSIVQILQHMRKQAATFLINGRHVSLDMPAGCAIISPPADMTLSLPSFRTNAVNDYLYGTKPWLKQGFPQDKLWPAIPPRGDLFADNSALCHPFISSAACTDWSGAPPVWIGCGEETHEDGIKFLVRNLVRAKVPTQLVQYEFMPHIFPMILHRLPQSNDCMARWGRACQDMVKGSFHTGALFIRLGALRVEDRDIFELSQLSDEDVKQTMRSQRDHLAQFVWVGSRAGFSKI